MSEASREKQIAILKEIKAGYSRRMAVFRWLGFRRMEAFLGIRESALIAAVLALRTLSYESRRNNAKIRTST